MTPRAAPKDAFTAAVTELCHLFEAHLVMAEIYEEAADRPDIVRENDVLREVRKLLKAQR